MSGFIDSLKELIKKMTMFDTHAYLAGSRFNKDRNQVIENALQEGIPGKEINYTNT